MSACVSGESISLLDFVIGVSIYVVCMKLVWYLLHGTQQSKQSPAIEAENCQKNDVLLRRCLSTMNWKLIANKARALHYMKSAYAQTPRVANQKSILKRNFSSSFPTQRTVLPSPTVDSKSL